MPKNFFIEKLLSIRNLSDHQNKAMICEVCEAAGRTDTSKNNATMFCVECQEKFCDDCSINHKNYKISRSHEQVKLDEGFTRNTEGIIRTSAAATCEKHKDKTLDVFCRDCKMAICVVCFIASHKQHDCSDISEVVDKMKQQMTSDSGCLSGGVGKQRNSNILGTTKEGIREAC